VGQVQEEQKILLQARIARFNDLFDGDLSPGDKLVYVNSAMHGKLPESEVLIEQAQSNSKERFTNSPDLAKEMLNAIMDAPGGARHDEQAGARLTETA
jgi:type I restriction enzyme R subunit